MSPDSLPLGKQPIYRAMHEAGLPDAKPLRNIPWINVANDGMTVMNIWRRQLRERDGTTIAVIDARRWLANGGTQKKKREAVVNSLSSLDGRQIRIVILEERILNSRKSAGAQFDAAALWLVEDTGNDFVLWRGRDPSALIQSLPKDPEEFGQVVPRRKEVVSLIIERDPRVRRFTLQRSGNRCEIQNCVLWQEFDTLDVHHIVRLGDGGGDHTDNTVALCPACHAKVHRGTIKVRTEMQEAVETIRSQRSAPKDTVRTSKSNYG